MPKLQLLPAVDVADGQAVRLVRAEAGNADQAMTTAMRVSGPCRLSSICATSGVASRSDSAGVENSASKARTTLFKLLTP